MSYFGYIFLIPAIASAVIGYFIYKKDPGNNVNQMFGLYSILLTVCAFNDVMMSSATNAAELFNLLHIGSLRMFLFSVALHFFIVYTDNRRLNKTWILGIVYAISGAIILVIGPEQIFTVHYSTIWQQWKFSLDNSRPLAMVSLGWMMLQIIAIIILASRVIILEKDRVRRAQARMVLTGFLLSVLVPIIFDLVFPMFGTEAPQLASLPFLLGNIVIALAIARYDLFAFVPGKLTVEILKGISDAVVLTSADGRITYASNSLQMLMEMKEPELTGTFVNQLFEKPLLDKSNKLIGELDNNLKTISGVKNVLISYANVAGSRSRYPVHMFILKDVTDLLNAFNKVKLGEIRYKNIFENVQNIYFELDSSGMITEISPSISYYSQYEPVEMIGMNVIETFNVPEKYRNYLMQVGEVGELRNFEVEIIDKDGSKLSFLTNMKIIPGNDGTIDRIVGSASDISALKRAEALLIESESRYRNLIESSTDSIFLVDSEFRIITANSQLSLLLKLQAGINPVGSVLDELFPKQFMRSMTEGLNSVFETGKMYIFRSKLERTDGSVSWCSTSLSPLINESGSQINNVVIITRDISSLHHADEIIRRSEERLRFFLENLPGVAFGAAIGGQPDFIFGKFEKITGYAKDLLFDTSFRIQNLIHPDDLLSAAEAYKEISSNITAQAELEYRIITKSGVVRHLKTFLQSTGPDTDQAPTYIQGVIYDVTEEQKLVQLIRNAVIETEEQERQRFAEDLHDELGPLLSSIRLYMNAMQARAQNLGFGEINDTLEETKKLIDDSIRLTKEIAYNLMPEIILEFGLVAAIKSFCNVVNNANALLINIELQGVPENLRIKPATELTLFRVVKELIGNTIKHAGASIINIKLGLSGNRLRINYADNGKGYDLTESIRKLGSFGLKNIINRLDNIGGTIQIKSNKSNGSDVHIEVDLKQGE